ncbi:hypothetical protein QE152_g24614 [Popillia japonica]|uniref:Golgi integral membrane protein 4 n=1 Tax=Popillia japonica TaxID=7064 RepID=A0AAW1K723_POPJA
MTTSRIVRGTKGRIFVYVCAILIITGVIAYYNNIRTELDNVQKSKDQCHQQQENLSTQLQVISDYKQRLEKSLKTEKTEHQQAKAELESRVNEEKLKHQKATEEATLKFNSLQQHYNLLEQHYNLLQTAHEDTTRECSRKQNEQLSIINNLQSKLKEVQGQLQQCEREKENSLEHLKSQIEQLRTEKVNLENQVREISKRDDAQKQSPQISVKQQNAENQETLQAPNISDTGGSAKPSYAKQISVKDGEYKISANNVADLPPNNAEDEQNHAKRENAIRDTLAQVVLPPPHKTHKTQSSTPNSRTTAPLKVPTLTPETPQNKTSQKTNISNNPDPIPSPSKKLPKGENKTSQKTNISNNPDPIPSPSKKLPKGVVAVQNVPVEDNDVDANLVNNRYRNVADDANDKDKSAGGDRIVMDAQDKENGANEIFDVGGFNDDPNLVGKQDEQKNRIDVDYDHFQQNDPNIDENEDDDTDYGNHNILKEVAIRN